MLRNIVVIMGLLFSFNAFSSETINWTAKVEKVSVYPTGKVNIFLKALTLPNPGGSVWSCTSNSALLGDPANPSMLSTALMLYTTQQPVRIGIAGSGSNCTVTYMTAM